MISALKPSYPEQYWGATALHSVLQIITNTIKTDVKSKMFSVFSSSTCKSYVQILSFQNKLAQDVSTTFYDIPFNIY